MIRTIIKIDEDACDGCGLCVAACHEGAIGLVDGKAKLLRDDYCDGLGDCLPVCPTGAITFERREAAMFDEAAVKTNLGECRTEPPHDESSQPDTLPCGCPSTSAKAINRNVSHTPAQAEEPPQTAKPIQTEQMRQTPAQTHLNQWPIQIKLVPPNAPYFKGANLLVAVDCAAYAYGNFHAEYMKNRITIIGCPKLDEGDYTDKLTAIISMNDIKSVTVARMEVPCCGGIESAVKTALKNSGKMIPWQIVTISTDGDILDN